MSNKLKIKKAKYFFADGKPYFGPVHTGKAQKKFTGIMSTDESVQVFTEDEFLMMEMPNVKNPLKLSTPPSARSNNHNINQGRDRPNPPSMSI